MTETIPFLDVAAINGELRDEYTRALHAVIDHGHFVGGPEVDRFESEFARYCDAGTCVGVGNGTDALELILTGLGIGPGDEVIVPANTFVATAEAVLTVGARPCFIDVLPDTLLIDPQAAEAAITPTTSAVIAVHLYGQMADVQALESLTRRHGLALIEDAAQAAGARFGGRRAGSTGVAAAFSFYPAKNLGGLGDGGAVTTSDRDLADRIRRIADHGRSSHDRNLHDLRGRNSRLDSLQAAFLSARLSTLDGANAARRRAVDDYRAMLPTRFRLVETHPDAEPVHHLAVARVPDRRKATDALTAARIGWGVHYPLPCHRQPAFAKFAADAPVVEEASAKILSLPMSPTLTGAQIRRVSEVLRASESA